MLKAQNCFQHLLEKLKETSFSQSFEKVKGNFTTLSQTFLFF
jgi:hypothetical protein